MKKVIFMKPANDKQGELQKIGIKKAENKREKDKKGKKKKANSFLSFVLSLIRHPLFLHSKLGFWPFCHLKVLIRNS